MDNGHVQSVLRCGQCNKPFDKQSSLKRHGYYCRSRRYGSIARSRSCTSCARRKARCDNRLPGCSRCIANAIECHYPASAPKGPGPRLQHGYDATTERRNLATSPVADFFSAENRQEAIDGVGMILDSAHVIPDPEFASIGGEHLGWDDPDLNFSDLWNLQTNDESAKYPSSGPSSSARHSTPTSDQTFEVQPALSASSISIPTLPTNTIRSLILRPRRQTETQRTANLILHTLKSYPLMMLRHNTLPPFIHPHLISSDVEDIHMEPLTNCISLVHMVSSGYQRSRKLFWKNVRLECERLFEEHLKLNKWELLAAIQALSIYILIRLDEGETDHNNFDSLLIAAVTVIAKQLTYSSIACNTQPVVYNDSLEKIWKDWIFEESRHRLSVVYRVVNMLVYFEPAAMCNLQKDLSLAPLPAKKQLWEAGDELMWKAVSEKEHGAQAAFGLAANGELVELDRGQLYCGDAVLRYKSPDAKTPSGGTGNWEEWCSGMDGFGGLVMLTASLVV